MENLYIDRKGTELDVEGQHLLIRVPGERPRSLPLVQLRFITVSASVQLSSRLLLALDSAGVTLVVLNPRSSGNWLVCSGNRHGNSARRLRQYQWWNRENSCLQAARQLVAAKITGQYRSLLQHRRQRPNLRRPLSRALEQLRQRRQAVLQAQTLDVLRGVEGAASAAYFGALTQLVAPVWNFRKRLRRPPPDPVNALLSLSYTLAHGEAVQALVSCGLDPALGFLHQFSYSRESLACDLMELLRADIDRWVLALLRDGALTPTQFHFPSADQCLLGKEGRAVFYSAYRNEVIKWRKRCRKLASQWAARLEQETSCPEELKDDAQTTDH
ncbi:CRISP-associated protein Cas1 [Microbulbifer thermotolerans]|uniref:CRISPR-associated endonuclease Cas1 n=1 Tax=Microbulbifer thermotolerans TaxID=252514 RepID=UPI0008E854AA|nr:CRISPR-associated endonuclease Cas1 [Microbulbifer thermotolerans]SFD09698.1 CRISP-associated protein Cas1 [Microbulbifer thermotolerans]